MAEDKRTEGGGNDYQKRIRHDLINKFQIIKGYLELLEDIDLPDKANDYIDKITSSTRESTELLEEWKKLQKKKGK